MKAVVLCLLLVCFLAVGQADMDCHEGAVCPMNSRATCRFECWKNDKNELECLERWYEGDVRAVCVVV